MMMTNNIDFFPQRPDSHPKIYAYEHIGVESQKGYIKVGYTVRDVEARVYEIEHTSGVPYKILESWNAMKNDGSCFTDHDVHNVLRKVFVSLKREKIKMSGLSVALMM